MGEDYLSGGKFFQIVDRISEVVLLGLMWLITSLPVITIGVSTAALYRTVLKVHRNGEGKFFQVYRREWRENLGNGILGTCIYGALFLLFWINFRTTRGTNSVLIGISSGILLASALYFFPMIASFRLKWLQYFQASLFLAIHHVFTTIQLLVTFALSTAVVLIIPVTLPVIVVGYEFYATFLLEKIFREYGEVSEDCG